MLGREEKLIAVNEKYHQLYKSNPLRLRSAIPVEDIWRFFIEKRVQCHGSGFTLLPYYISDYRDHLHLSLKELGDYMLKKREEEKETFKRNYFEKNPSHNSGHFFSSDEYNEFLEKNKAKPWLDKDLENFQLHQFAGYFNLEKRDVQKRIILNDIVLMDKGWVTFELKGNEPGYCKALYMAFQKIFESEFFLPLSTQLICNFHEIASRGVLDQNLPIVGSKENIGKFKKSANTFDLKDSNSTKEGVYCLATKNKPYLKFNIIEIGVRGFYLECKEENVEKVFEYLQDEKYRVIIESDLGSSDNVNQEMNQLINHYYLGISQAKTPLEKLRAIIVFVQGGVQLHPFSDGNCRTFVMLLLNYLLIQNGFPLTLLEDANHFAAYSTEELIDKVIQGMENVFELIETKALFGVTTDKIISDLKSVNQPEAQTVLKLHHELNEMETKHRSHLNNCEKFDDFMAPLTLGDILEPVSSLEITAKTVNISMQSLIETFSSPLAFPTNNSQIQKREEKSCREAVDKQEKAASLFEVVFK